jgi:heat shock protein HtpX
MCKKHFLVLLLATAHLANAEMQKKITNPFASMYDRIRDLTVEALIVQNFVLNSDKIVEVDSANYPELNATMEELSKKASINRPLTFVITKKVPNFFAKANAFTCGDENESVVFVGSWVLDNMSHDEIAGILAHEITHIKKNHVMKQLGVNMITLGGSIGLSLALQQYFLKNTEFAALGAVVLGTVVSSAATAYYSRRCEKEADLGAVQLMGNKKLAQSLQKLDRIIKKYAPYTHWQMKNNPSIFDTHPPMDKRIAYIEEAQLVTA